MVTIYALYMNKVCAILNYTLYFTSPSCRIGVDVVVAKKPLVFDGLWIRLVKLFLKIIIILENYTIYTYVRNAYSIFKL